MIEVIDFDMKPIFKSVHRQCQTHYLILVLIWEGEAEKRKSSQIKTSTAKCFDDRLSLNGPTGVSQQFLLPGTLQLFCFLLQFYSWIFLKRIELFLTLYTQAWNSYCTASSNFSKNTKRSKMASWAWFLGLCSGKPCNPTPSGEKPLNLHPSLREIAK